MVIKRRKGKMDMEDFKKKLEDKLSNISKQPRGDKTEWTSAIKKCLVELAEDLKLSSSCNLSLLPGKTHNKHDNHEWLCDIMLYKATEKGIEEVVLCVESEWSTDEDELFWDFSKLLVIRSKFHLMIFDAYKDKYEEVLQKLENYLENSKVCDRCETYLFAAYLEEKDEKLTFKEHTWK
jgi:hypothetical protein